MTNLKKLRTFYARLSKNTIETAKTIIEGKVYADFDADGKVVGFEFIDPLEVEFNGEIKDVE